MSAAFFSASFALSRSRLTASSALSSTGSDFFPPAARANLTSAMARASGSYSSMAASSSSMARSFSMAAA